MIRISWLTLLITCQRGLLPELRHTMRCGYCMTQTSDTCVRQQVERIPGRTYFNVANHRSPRSQSPLLSAWSYLCLHCHPSFSETFTYICHPIPIPMPRVDQGYGAI